jgi:anthranilate phosphoribosyltransferase
MSRYQLNASPRLDAAPFIKDIGRGSQHPSDLSYERAFELWHAALAGRLDPVALGGVLIAMRVKGETAEEVAAFLFASAQFAAPLKLPAGVAGMPLVIPSYNGARKMPNLTPLLAVLLARHGVPVLVHGSSGSDIPHGRPARVTSAAIFAALGFSPARDGDDVLASWARSAPAFMPIEHLNPALARVLALRAVLGVRNSSHTLVKLLQPFQHKALCLSSYTHPEYLTMLSTLFARQDMAASQDTLLLRATEGEAVANARRALPMQWFRNQQVTTLMPDDNAMSAALDLPLECSLEASVGYIKAVLDGRVALPASIAWQQQMILECRAVST